MTTIVNSIDVRLNILRVLTAHRIYVDTVNNYVMQLQFLRRHDQFNVGTFRLVRAEARSI